VRDQEVSELERRLDDQVSLCNDAERRAGNLELTIIDLVQELVLSEWADGSPEMKIPVCGFQGLNIALCCFTDWAGGRHETITMVGHCVLNTTL